jgi:hypothetical protein
MSIVNLPLKLNSAGNLRKTPPLISRKELGIIKNEKLVKTLISVVLLRNDTSFTSLGFVTLIAAS